MTLRGRGCGRKKEDRLYRPLGLTADGQTAVAWQPATLFLERLGPGEAAGRVLWPDGAGRARATYTLPYPTPVVRGLVPPKGDYILLHLGGPSPADGVLARTLLLAADGRLLWERSWEKPLGAVALSETGRVAVLPLDVYRQLLGHDLYLYDPSGAVLRYHSAEGLAPALALSPDGGAVAVVAGGNRLLYLGGG